MPTHSMHSAKPAMHSMRPLQKRLYDYVYSAGDSIEPADGYRAFRGRDAVVEPMLKKRGLIEA